MKYTTTHASENRRHGSYLLKDNGGDRNYSARQQEARDEIDDAYRKIFDLSK